MYGAIRTLWVEAVRILAPNTASRNFDLNFGCPCEGDRPAVDGVPYQRGSDRILRAAVACTTPSASPAL